MGPTSEEKAKIAQDRFERELRKARAEQEPEQSLPSLADWFDALQEEARTQTDRLASLSNALESVSMPEPPFPDPKTQPVEADLPLLLERARALKAHLEHNRRLIMDIEERLRL